MNRKQRVAGLSLAGALLLPAAGALAQETIAYGVANFGGTGQCGTSGMTHPVHTATSQVVANYFTALKNAGQWTQSHTVSNTNVRTDLWTDFTKTADPANALDLQTFTGVDDADVLFLHTHGGHGFSPARSTFSMGSSADACTASTATDMLFGNVNAQGTGQLDIAVIKACQSGDYDVWKAGGYKSLVTSGSSFTMWNAFHGDSSCGNFVKDYVDDYMHDSKWDGVGENWLDAAYDWGVIYDDCPVSIIFGATKSARHGMYFNGGWRDRKNTGLKTGSTIFYVSGCNPDSGSKLP